MTDLRHVLPHPPDPSHLERYVLGLLDEPACEAIEEDAFGNPDVALAIDEAETRLIDRYVAGTLVPAQRASVERALAARPRLRERLQVARALASSPSTRIAGGGWWLPLAAAAAILVAAGVWNARTLTPQDEVAPQAQAEPGQGASAPDHPDHPVETPPVGTEPGVPPAPAPPPPVAVAPRQPVRSVFAVTLPVGVSRSAAPTPVDVQSSATHVELRVPVAPGDDYPRYRLSVSDARGREIGAATVPTLSASRTVSIVVERRVLPDGAYDVAVEGLDAQGTPEPLAFLQVRVTGRP
ncbi:hypothetical protein [Luteitalea sp.]|uniref:hypothetical protein n=1 Tax=Luteitalea sp. TaxID=2004800 RepID=UPI0025C2D844|nr:hypothetical protein [Luteitalea sp.]